MTALLIHLGIVAKHRQTRHYQHSSTYKSLGTTTFITDGQAFFFVSPVLLIHVIIIMHCLIVSTTKITRVTHLQVIVISCTSAIYIHSCCISILIVRNQSSKWTRTTDLTAEGASYKCSPLKYTLMAVLQYK